jgi:diguanylate cyclase (GGDEF)-like protein
MNEKLKNPPNNLEQTSSELGNLSLEQQLAEEIEKNQRLEKENQRLREEIKRLESDLIHDSKTGLKTARYFEEDLKEKIAGLSRGRSERREEVGPKNLSCLFCDIDDFGKINKIYGHLFGDEILREVARLLKDSIRSTDTIARWGGEEIIISLPGVDEEGAKNKAEELRKIIEEGIAEKYKDDPNYQDFKLTLSIGVGSHQEGDTLELLIDKAEKASREAKKRGKNCVITFSEFEKSQLEESDKK